MLANLQDVFAFTEAEALDCPEIADEVILRRKGDLGDDIEKVVHDLGLPPIYSECVDKIGMFGVSLGYFNLWPGSGRVKNLAEALYQANNDDDPVGELARAHHLVYVASEEANWVCVGAANHEGADIVTYIETMLSPTPSFFPIAPDFEKFLILAANLNEISLANLEDPERVASLMLDCCKAVGCTQGQTRFWTENAVYMTT